MLPQITRILYATDLSEHARHAFGYAAAMANKFGAKVTILHVIEELSDSSANMISTYMGADVWNRMKAERREEYQNTITGRLKEFYAEMCRELAECPFLFERYIIKEGDPSTVILEKSGDYDMVVMGSHGHGLFAGALMGNTARQVVRRCVKPVLVIRIPEE